MTQDQASVWQAEIANWQLILSEIQALIGLASLIFLAVYVIKTWQIATETKRAAEATAAKATTAEAQAAIRQIQEMRQAREAAAIAAEQQLGEMQRAREAANMASAAELGELTSARLANIRPYVYVSIATYGNRDVPPGDFNFILDLELANWGPGPPSMCMATSQPDGSLSLPAGTRSRWMNVSGQQ